MGEVRPRMLRTLWGDLIVVVQWWCADRGLLKIVCGGMGTNTNSSVLGIILAESSSKFASHMHHICIKYASNMHHISRGIVPTNNVQFGGARKMSNVKKKIFSNF